MKTNIDLPDDLMRALKIRASETNQEINDVVVELIQRGLAGSPIEGEISQSVRPRNKGDALDAMFAAGDELAQSGIDIAGWAARSREAWRRS